MNLVTSPNSTVALTVTVSTMKRLLLFLAITGLVHSSLGQRSESAGKDEIPPPVHNASEPISPNQFYERGLKRLSEGRVDEAIADFNAAIKMSPEYSDPYHNRGNAYRRKEQWEKAIADYTEALRLDPKHPVANRARGDAFFQIGDLDSALADFDTAIEVSAEGVNYFLRGNAHHAKGEFQKALADFTESIRITPGFTSTYRHLAWLLATCPDSNLRDGHKAMTYANIASCLGIPGFNNLEVTAAALAEAHQFPSAVIYEKHYLETSSLSKAEAAESRERLALYENQQPFRTAKPRQLPKE